MKSPLAQILDHRPFCILDGGFATELERRGIDLDDPLWSARLLLENHDPIIQVHEDYLRSGADIILTCSYQATVEGFMERGLSKTEATGCLQAAVTLAQRARRNLLQSGQCKNIRPPAPLVAASIGPYGAFLADGSEYTGNYGLSDRELEQFHRERMTLLWQATPDILACETLPCLQEGLVLARLARELDCWCWVSFSASDGYHTSQGDRLSECARLLDAFDQVAAIGVNCTRPEYVTSLIDEIRSACSKPVIVYPNSGERYDSQHGSWSGDRGTQDFPAFAKQWYKRGARIIGGCCRTTPDDIGRIGSYREEIQQQQS